jgi:hypothetical protein
MNVKKYDRGETVFQKKAVMSKKIPQSNVFDWGFLLSLQQS